MSHTPPSPSAQPPKSILKKSSSTSIPAGAGHVEPTRAKFDEMNVLETLHPPGKDYGHMKIDEPKTPYNYAEHEHGPEDAGPSTGTAGLDHKSLIQKLTEQAGAPPRAARSLSTLSMHDSDSEESENDDPAAKKEFISKRKSHYNEFQAIQRARALIQQEEQDQDKSNSSDEERKCSRKK